MGKKLVTTFVGLPYFAKKLCVDLSGYTSKQRFRQFDTYYSKWDQLKAKLFLKRSDIVYSINGSLTGSRVFDTALDNHIPLIMHWVGTDVLKAMDAVKNGKFRDDYRKKALHFCEVSWIQEELKSIGIEAEIVNFASFEKEFEPHIPSGRFTVLSYIADKRSGFYGMNEFLQLAIDFPEINFVIVGTEANDYEPLPNNVKAMGWVEDMGIYFDQAHMTMRFPEHDGLSNFILESMARGKQVLYRYAYTGCLASPTYEDLRSNLQKQFERYENGEFQLNKEAIACIRNEFNREVILGGLVSRFEKIAGK